MKKMYKKIAEAKITRTTTMKKQTEAVVENLHECIVKLTEKIKHNNCYWYPIRTILTTINHNKESNNSYLTSIRSEEDNGYTPTKAAFAEARMRVGQAVFRDIFIENSKFIQKNTELKTINDYRLIAFDGTTFVLPNKKYTFEEFGGPTNQTDRETPMARAEVCYDMLNSIIIDVEADAYEEGEITLFREMIQRVKEAVDNPVFVLDRLYCSHTTMLDLELAGIKFIIKAKEVQFAEITSKITKKDDIIESTPAPSTISALNKTYGKENVPNKFEYRVVSCYDEFNKKDYVFTNLTMEEFDAMQVRYAYKGRWKVETCIEKMKNKICIEKFTGYRSTIIMQDIYSALINLNISFYLLNMANAEFEKKCKEKNVPVCTKGADGKIIRKHVNHNTIIKIFRRLKIYALALFDDITEKISKIFKGFEYDLEAALKDVVTSKIDASFPRNFRKQSTVPKSKTNLKV